MNATPEEDRLLYNLNIVGYDESAAEKYLSIQKEKNGRHNCAFSLYTDDHCWARFMSAHT